MWFSPADDEQEFTARPLPLLEVVLDQVSTLPEDTEFFLSLSYDA